MGVDHPSLGLVWGEVVSRASRLSQVRLGSRGWLG